MKIRVQPGGLIAPERRDGALPVPGGWLEAEQVAWSADRRWAVGVSGRLRNAASLRAELSARGQVEPDASGAELAACVIAEAGFERALGRLEGEIALAAWDGAEERLWAARDAAGAWRVYHRQEGAAQLVRTEPPDQGPGGAVIDGAALGVLCGLGVLPAPRALWTGWERLAAGSLLRRTGSGRAEAAPWRAVEIGEPGIAGAGYRWARSVGYALDLAVRQATEGPTAVLLSGGLCGRTLLERAAARRGTADRLLAVHADLSAHSADGAMDRAEARAQAAAAGVEIVEVACTPETAVAALSVLAGLPEPLVSPGMILLIPALQAAAARGLPQVVSGLGGPWVFGQDRPHRLALAGAAGRLAALSGALPGIGADRREVLEVYGEPAARWLSRWRWRGGIGAGGEGCWAEVDALGAASPRQDGPGMALWMDRRLYLAEALWPGFRMLAGSMGMEGGLPLADPRVLHVSAQVPTGQLLWGRRGLLGRAAGGALPERRPPQVPAAAWLRGPLAGLLAGLPDRLGRLEGTRLAPERARGWISELQAGRDRGQILWGLLTIAGWLEAHS